MPRWAGPPPLLIAATVLGLLIAPAVSHADAGDSDPSRPAAAATLAVAEPAAPPVATPAATPTASPSIDGTPAPEPVEAPAAKKAPEIASRTIGVATFNQYVDLTTAEATADALALTARDTVSIVGWQEGFSAGPVYQRLVQEGWATKRYVATKGARELAVSWRKDEFALVGSALHKLADGVAEGSGLYPFGTRYALRVTLRDRASGEKISVINTHLPQRVENLDDPGTWNTNKNAIRASRQLDGLAGIWASAPGRWVVGTGDYNIAALADQRARNAGGIVSAYAGIARSSYSVLGFAGLLATHPTSKRFIDYVHVAAPALREGRIELLRQRTPRGLTSDHRPLLVRMRLS
ncbi:hypothetical protein [Nocardioides sp.]|uniref:hypothetical protein n=1 Tax=Nocardioides sp. TaxID=35761 RepID=UPI002B275BDB|nr:hypothetical protein [Nocardioides sp.]